MVGHEKTNATFRRKYFLMGLFGISLIGSIVFTQIMASKLGYQSALGKPIFEHVYYPWKGFEWWNNTPSLALVFEKYFTIIVSACMMILSFGMLFLVSYNPATKANATIHGTSRFAEKKEFDNLLIPSSHGESVVIGGYEVNGKVEPLYHKTGEHVSLIAPTGSGKGVAIILPTLFTWVKSVVVLDIKLEAWNLTSGWRKKHANNIVLLFEPTDDSGKGARFNALEEIRVDTNYDVGDARVIANMIVKPEGATMPSGGGSSKFFDDTSEAFITGLFLHLIYKNKYTGKPYANLPDVAKTLGDPRRPTKLLLIEMMYGQFYKGGAHPVAASAAATLDEMDERTLSNTISSIRQHFKLFEDPVIAKNIASSDFSISDLMNHEKPVSLYLGIRPSKKASILPLVKLVMTLIVTKLTDEMAYEDGRVKRNYNHKLLTLYDEFSSLGKMSILEDQLAYIRSYGILSMVVIQDLKQLYKHYSVNETFLSGSYLKAYFSPNEIKTAEYISKDLGKTTVTQSVSSTTGKRFSVMLDRVSRQEKEHSRDLLTPDEVRRLRPAEKDENEQIISAGEMLITRTGNFPIRGTQPLYFFNKKWTARSKVPPPERSDSIISEKLLNENG